MIEAVVIGRVGVDLTPPEPRVSLGEAASFVRAVGGFAGNIGTGLARLGVATAVVSAVGDDGNGTYVRAFLAGEGIDVRPIAVRAGSLTQVAFFEVWPPEHFPTTFYRFAPAPEALLTVDELPVDLLERAPVVVVSGTLLAEEPARSTALRVLADRRAARDRRAASHTIFDLDWRPTLWPDPDQAPELIGRAARLSDILIGSDAEFDAAGLSPEVGTGREGQHSGGGVHPRPSLASPLEGPELIVLKHGGEGVSLITLEGRRSVPGIPVEVVCGIGAGDALTAAFGAGLLRGLDPLSAVERGNAAGAIVATRLMCSTAMPTPVEIDDLLAGRRAPTPQEVHP
jgi:5-dehydro-2-deoxygluconokinase